MRTTYVHMAPASSVDGGPVGIEKCSRNKRKFRADIRTTSVDIARGNCYGDIAQEVLNCQPDELNKPSFLVNKSPEEVETNHSSQQILSTGSPTMNSQSINVQGPSDGSKNDHELEEELDPVEWGDNIESELENLLMKALDATYKDAVNKLISMEYSAEQAIAGVLKNGRCYGVRDALSNIVDNAMASLTGKNQDLDIKFSFRDFKELQRFALAEMVCVLREVRPGLSKGDAMWCLLMSDMNIAQACSMENASIVEINKLSRLSPASLSIQSTGDSPVLSQPNTGSAARDHSIEQACQTRVHLQDVSVGNRNGINSQAASGGGNELAAERSIKKESTEVAPSGYYPILNSPKVTQISQRANEIHPDQMQAEPCRKPNCPLMDAEEHSSVESKTCLGDLCERFSSASFTQNTNAALQHRTEELTLLQRDPVPILACSPEDRATGEVQIASTPNCDKLVQTWITSQTGTQVDFSKLAGTGDKGTELSLGIASSADAVACLGDDSNVFDKQEKMTCSDKVAKKAEAKKKDELIKDLSLRVKELEAQVQERTEWARKKVLQAAQRLSKDFGELKMLRAEKEEMARQQKEMQASDENNAKRILELENALRKASAQADQLKNAMRKLENENAELRAEMEAAKLSAAESVASCLEVAKREKRSLKKAQAWEKQRAKLQEELTTEKRKTSHLQQEITQAKEKQQQAEVRCRQEVKAREEAVLSSEFERRAREQAEASAKRREESICRKAETDLQRYRNEIQRLEREVTQYRFGNDPSQPIMVRWGSGTASLADIGTPHSLKEINACLRREIADLQDLARGELRRDRECVMCMCQEMSVVFLPCAHQVVCSSCNELHEKQGMRDCPSCRTPIQQRIRVYGVNA